MNNTPRKIFENVNNKTLDKLTAVENLIALIENSDKMTIRLDCVKALDNIGLNSNRIFDIMENLLISDSHERIRNTAALYIKKNFIEKSLKPMSWALLHEISPLCLNTIYNTIISFLEKISSQCDIQSKLMLIEALKKVNEKEFKIGFELLFESLEPQQFTLFQLTDILLNYYTITYFKKIFWRLKYKIVKGKIVLLDFIFKGLSELPEGIKYLSSLKDLILRYNQIVKLPKWIGNLPSLEVLNLNVNNIVEIPESIGNLSKLKELSLWKNELENVPNSIGNLSSLEELNLRLNRINFLPDAIGDLRSLKILNLHDNKLTSIPESIKNLTLLEKLNLSWNEITEVPNSLSSLGTLHDLDLSRNQLKSIPESLSLLKSLKILNLKDNRLKYIPETVGSLPNLEILDLSNNELESIPESFGSLKSLNELYIGGNNITEIPKTLKILKLKRLKIYS